LRTAVKSKNLYILSFLLILAAIGLSLQYSYASVDEEEEESDTQDSEDEQDSEGESSEEESSEEESSEEESSEEESSEDAEDTTVTEETANDTVTNLTLTKPKINTSITGDLFPPAYQVKTTFYNIIVHNDHDGLARGDGEWDLVAFVQGIRVPLTEKSCRTNPITTGDSVADCGLGSIEGGTTAYFGDLGKPLDLGTSVTVQLPRTVPLSIFTAGIEEDDCGRAEIPDEKSQQELMSLMRDERLNWIEPIRNFIGSVRAIDNLYTVTPLSDPVCGYSDLFAGSDKLGNIIKFYEPIDYGKSDACIRDKSDSGDYTLCYRITVTPLQTCPAAHIADFHTYCKK
jgi:hypothetical protein